jgi:DNA invertase Pin-like site-specific DNA recombinase
MDTLHIYTRVSSSAQEEDGTSLDTQKELGIKKAKELGMKAKVWNEGGQSSKGDDLLNRPELATILTQIESGEIKHLWVFNTDRLSRNETTWGVIRLRLVQHQVTLHTPSGIFLLSNPMDKLLLGILSEFSSFDNAQRADRSRLGKMKRISQGYWMGGPPPFGYKIEEKKLVANRDEAKWVSYIFQSYRDGKTVREIKRKLLESGVKTRRGNSVWSHGSIDALLTNTHYAGYYVVRDKKTDQTTRSDCEPILSPALVSDTLKEKAKRTKRRVKESNQKHFYLLRDFLICDHCEARFCARHYPKQYRSVYYCPRKERNFVNAGTGREMKCTNSRYLKIEETERLIWETTLKVLSESHRFKEELKRQVLSETGSFQDRATESAKLKKQLRGLVHEIQEATNSIITLETDRLLQRRSATEIEKIIESVEHHRTDLRAKHDELVARIHSVETQTKWIDWISEFGQRINQLDSLSSEERKKLLAGVVQDIRVRTLNVQKHQLTIRFRLPYVGDSLFWVNPKSKAKGYDIRGGSDSVNVSMSGSKKNRVARKA